MAWQGFGGRVLLSLFHFSAGLAGVARHQVILDTIEFGSKIKKTPVVVGNCTGFAVNRVFFPYTMAAIMLVDLGIDPYFIDKVIYGFGMPMGPFRCVNAAACTCTCVHACADVCVWLSDCV
jgi:3-hydroxyacyl-CoA dehydrogenase